MLAVTQSGHTYTIGSGFTVLDQARRAMGPTYFSGALAYLIRARRPRSIDLDESGAYDTPRRAYGRSRPRAAGARALELPSTGLVDNTTRADRARCCRIGGYWGGPNTVNAQLPQ